MSDNDWYYTNGGQQQGPVPLEHLRSWLAAGQLQPSELVWREGMPSWVAAGQVPELQGLVPQATAAAVTPAQYQPGMTGAIGAPGFAVNYYTPQLVVAYANFGLRFVAMIIDWLIIGLPFTLAGFAIEYVANQSASGPSPAYFAMSMALNLGSIVAAWLYEAMLTSGPRMATVGKRVVGIHVTDMNGQRISFGRATGRHFAKILSGCILLIGYFMAAFTERKQALHDMIASTLVLETPK